MTGLIFRDATVADLRFILQSVVEDSVVPTGDDPANANDPRYVAALDAMRADPNQMMMIAELDGAPVGTIQLTFIPGIPGHGLWRGLIENVHITPSQRNKGFGAQMIQWAIEQSRARGCGLVQLTSNKKRLDAHRFYERLGFEKSHDGFKLRF
jgi:GNAT superfamily N-acetyltransferase